MLLHKRDKRFMPLVRALVVCAQNFERYSSSHARQLGLTPPQFDIIATLGNTDGMSCKELGAKTLITKGTMTGLLTRLERKRLLTRADSPLDGRSWITRLTPKGQALFEEIFPAHLAYLAPVFANFTSAEMDGLRLHLNRLSAAFEASNTKPDKCQ